MRFTLQPPLHQMALVFPALLVSALPVALSANPEQPGVTLPPASLYDARPAEPTVLAPVTAQAAPATTPAAPPPAVIAAPTPPPAAPATAASPGPPTAQQAAATPPNRGTGAGSRGCPGTPRRKT